MTFLQKEKCFGLAPINGGSEGHVHGGSATTHFFGGSKKYFGTHHAVLSTKSKEIQPENQTVSMHKCLSIFYSNARAPVTQLITPSDQNYEVSSLNSACISMSFLFCILVASAIGLVAYFTKHTLFRLYISYCIPLVNRLCAKLKIHSKIRIKINLVAVCHQMTSEVISGHLICKFSQGVCLEALLASACLCMFSSTLTGLLAPHTS